MWMTVRQFSLGIISALALAATAAPTLGQERFEVTSIKKVRPTLVDTVAALQARDVAKARAAFEGYDSLWNGVEVYINVRSRDLYGDLEHNYQAKITKALESNTPDFAATLADAQAMLAKYDEAIALVQKAAPLNPMFDDVARLRIVRAHLREVLPALKANNLAKAKKSFEAFDENWDSIEDLIKARSAESYVTIEKDMIEIEKALEPTPPDVAKVTTLVAEIMRLYNAAVTEVTRDARAKM
jgi:tetratricopeptide (TPR) repeat protein